MPEFFPKEILESPPTVHEVHVVHPPKRRYWLHALLFVATVFTTLVVGARLQYNFSVGAPQFTSDDDLLPIFWVFEEPSRLVLGIPFSAALLCILLAHEMGHFVYARRRGVNATLPFFLPAPTVIGTFGAFIRIRSPIPNRAALMDLGIAGPIAGFAVAVPILFFSLWLATPLGHSSEQKIGLPLAFSLAWRAVHASRVQCLSQMNLHPASYAAWVGFLATALNLLPAGQLDGGHIVYSIFPRFHRLATRLTSLALLPMGIFLWGGWLFWGAVLLLPWMKHPPVPEIPEMGRGRKMLGIAAVIMLISSFPVVPFVEYSPWQQIQPWIARHLSSSNR